jgi:hypothetical protein
MRSAIVPIMALCLYMPNCTLGGEDASHLVELKRLAAETPVFPDFAEVQFSRHMGKREIAVLTYFYRCSCRYNEVKNFYVTALTARGWMLRSEEDVPKWFTRDGSKALTFKRGEYTIEVEYDAAANAAVPFSVAFAWHLNDSI